jgi:hypothetical protein
LLRVLNT